MAAKEKTSSRWAAWLAPILFLLAAVAAAGPASALTCGALETRAWEKTSARLDSRLDESLQLLNLHQRNESGGYDCALGSPLAAENGAVWKLPGTDRGVAIEKNLVATEYKDWFHVGAEQGGTFPLVDFQQGNTLVSLKTVDTTGTGWVDAMQAHIDDLATRGATVSGQPANMVLDLRVQPGGASAAQRLVQYAQANYKNVTVVVKEYP